VVVARCEAAHGSASQAEAMRCWESRSEGTMRWAKSVSHLGKRVSSRYWCNLGRSSAGQTLVVRRVSFHVVHHELGEESPQPLALAPRASSDTCGRPPDAAGSGGHLGASLYSTDREVDCGAVPFGRWNCPRDHGLRGQPNRRVSASTMIRTSSSKVTDGFHPNRSRALRAFPSSTWISAGRYSRGSIST